MKKRRKMTKNNFLYKNKFEFNIQENKYLKKMGQIINCKFQILKTL